MPEVAYAFLPYYGAPLSHPRVYSILTGLFCIVVCLGKGQKKRGFTENMNNSNPRNARIVFACLAILFLVVGIFGNFSSD